MQNPRIEIRNRAAMVLPKKWGADSGFFLASMSALLWKKSTIVMLSVALLFFAGHYYVYTTPIDVSRQIRLVIGSALLGLGLFGSLLLFANPKSARSQKIFACEMLMVAFATMFTLARLIWTDGNAVPSQLTSCGTLIYGNVYAFVLLIYPLELLNPGRMTAWKYFRLFLPVLLTGLFYYGYFGLSGHHMIMVASLEELGSNFHKFDMWFRLIIFAYPMWMFFLIIRQKKRYADWRCKNVPNIDCINLRWLDYYLFGYFLILISYMIVVLLHNFQSLIMHGLAFLLFFGFGFFNILRQKETVLSDSSQDDELVGKLNPGHACCRQETAPVSACFVEDKYRFVDKIPQYKADLERWMEERKPYQDKDFKLLDVMQALPLNRSYISRLFNEGYGESFFNFVMRCRIEESIRLLEAHPDMPIRHISEVCGFSSPSVFGRAFLKNKGVTPLQYRKNFDIENP